MADPAAPSNRVLVTGASGFVGRNVVRELIARGYHPVCLARSAERFLSSASGVPPALYTVAAGSLFEPESIVRAARGTSAVIHLVGIIIEKRGPIHRQSFRRVHVDGTRNVLNAAREAGVPRICHMSALGSRPDAPSVYHRTKYEAEQLVRASGMAWTIFRPSIIHGPDGEFMHLMKSFVASPVPPVIPYFGKGEKKLQPVSVKDVATCFVAALGNENTIGKSFDMGGPQTYNWKQLYETCRALIPHACRNKPKVGVPVLIAKAIGAGGDLADLFTGFRFGIPFNLGQVQMSQEDSTCDIRPVEETFGIKLRDFETELARYAGQIR